MDNFTETIKMVQEQLMHSLAIMHSRSKRLLLYGFLGGVIGGLLGGLLFDPIGQLFGQFPIADFRRAHHRVSRH